MRNVHRSILAALVVALLVATPLQAVASEAQDAEADESATVRWGDQLRVADTSSGLGLALWSWPERDRLYQLHHSDLVMRDAGTGAELGRATLDPKPWGPGLNSETTAGAGRHHVAAVDRADGRVFVAYQTDATQAGTGATPCPAYGIGVGCVAGLHVLDAGTLEALGRIPLELPTVEGARVVPIVRALEFAPADPEHGWRGQVLMIVEEVGHGPLENSLAPGLTTEIQRATPKRNSGNITYAIAFDPDTMRQEWAVRLEACRNAREQRDWYKVHEGHPSVVFRSGGAEPALYVGCHGNTSLQGVVVRVPLDEEGRPATMPLTIGDPTGADAPGDPAAGRQGLVAPAPRQETVAGPDKVTVMLADPVSKRIFMRVNDLGEVWWAFDGHANQFIGTIGIGGYNHGHTSYALDPDIGRLYVLAAEPEEGWLDAPGGLYVADIRRDPLPQALHFPHLALEPRFGRGLAGASVDTSTFPVMSVVPRSGGATTRVLQTVSGGEAHTFFQVIDGTPAGENPPSPSAVVRTLDVDEAPGVTEATFDGTARGFGFRTILVGGVEGATRVGPADAVGTVRGLPEMDGWRNDTIGTDFLANFVETFVPQAEGIVPRMPLPHGIGPTGDLLREVLPPPDPCADAQRELIVAFVGPNSPAVVDAASARGETQPIFADVRTREDVAAPVSRCAPADWKALWETALFGQPPVEEPGVDWPFEDATSSCTTAEQDTTDSWNDPVAGAFASEVACSEDEVRGWGQARGLAVDGVSVAHTLSTFRIYRDPQRGMVARVESIARGIDIAGVVKIDAVRGVAESWANGHSQAGAREPGDEAFNVFNCDRTRTAGTCFQRHIFGVTVAAPDGGVAYRCGPCGPEDGEDDLIDAMNRALGAFGYVRFREPSRELARGSADGYVAAITKKDKERFSDIVLNNDLLETMVPMLELVRYATHGRPGGDGYIWYEFGTPPRGRQIYQFAAVEVSSTYGIQCLLVYDAETSTCAPAAEELGSLTVQLTDAAGAPLAGGAFEVRADLDGDGVVGLVDALLTDGACVTAEDGIGTCTFAGLEPGGYLVSQTAAPAGYSTVAEPWVSQLAPGEARTVTFTNTSNLSVVEMTATDANGNPVEGAVFAVFPDPDADGRVAPDAVPVATCTTDAEGQCAMSVPVGSYVLVQTVAPAGMEPIEPVAFTFASGGQTAAVGVVNQPAGDTPAVSPAPGPVLVGYSPPVTSPPSESVGGSATPGTVAPPASLPDQVGGTVVRVIRAPGDALRLLGRDPKQAVAWIASLVLFGLATAAVRRRIQLNALLER